MSEEDLSGHAVLSYAVFSGGIAHFFFILLFYLSELFTLSIVNIFSVLTFLIARLLLVTTGNLTLVIFLSVLEVVGHSYIATYSLGWDSSFHYYILLFLGILPLALFTWSSRIIGSLLILLTYLGLWLLSHNFWIVQISVSSYESFFAIMNITFFIVILGFVTSFQGWMTYESRTALARELKNLEQAHKQINASYLELQDTQAQLLEAERLASLGQLVGGIAHEINNPIAVIKSNSELLRINLRSTLRELPSFLDTLNSDEKEIFYEIVERSIKNTEFLNTKEERKRRKEIQKEVYNLISDEEVSNSLSDSLSALRLLPPYDRYLKNLKVDRFQEFLKMAQIFKNKSSSLSDIELAIDKVSRIVFSLRRYLNTESHFSRKEINLVDEFENILHTYDNYVIGKINITKEFPSKLIFFGNTESISQVWKNILFNSIQAMYHAEKNIHLSIQEVEIIPEYLLSYVTSLSKEDLAIKTKEKNWALVSITDSGEGIPQNLQKKIFTPFFTTKPLGEGIGLGLYTCKKIVHEHGGVLFFKSETGSTEFVVALPLKSFN
jgi:two-component system, NtrC family, sensor kinase